MAAHTGPEQMTAPSMALLLWHRLCRPADCMVLLLWQRLCHCSRVRGAAAVAPSLSPSGLCGAAGATTLSSRLGTTAYCTSCWRAAASLRRLALLLLVLLLLLLQVGAVSSSDSECCSQPHRTAHPQ